jgi:hypothetical protein
MLFVWLAVIACLCAVPGLVSVTRCCSPEEPAGSAQGIDELIARLGSPNFELREAAQRQLMEREDAIPALRRALKSSDAEVARRARDILDALARKGEPRAFARLAELAKREAVDQAVELFAGRDKWHDAPACWQVMADLEARLNDLERRTYGSICMGPSYRERITDKDARGVANDQDLQIVASYPASQEMWKGRVVLRAQEIARGRQTMWGLFALSGNIKAQFLDSSAVFAGGSIEVTQIIGDALVVCDGDVTVGTSIKHSLLIARGTVHLKRAADGARIISCGEVRCDHPEWVRDTKIVEKEVKPLGFVTFFDPADMGIRVEKADGGARVKEAAKGQRFAKAGVRADDLITGVDGDKVTDAESFRRLLRARLAVDADMVLKVRRAEQAVEVRVPGKE